MKLENIMKQLIKDGYTVYDWQFFGKDFKYVNGTALADIINGEPVATSATYKQVLQQINEGRSHILTDKSLNRNLKL